MFVVVRHEISCRLFPDLHSSNLPITSVACRPLPGKRPRLRLTHACASVLRACVRSCVRACARARVCVCAHMRSYVRV